MVFSDAKIREVLEQFKRKEEERTRVVDAQAFFERFDSIIIGNERYKQDLAIALSDFLSPRRIRQHVLVTGPSGSGKTYMIEEGLNGWLSLPHCIIDASGLVPQGYDGRTFRRSMTEFFNANMTAATGCLIVIDEFDKVSAAASGSDIKSMGVQNEILTLMHGMQEGAIDTRQSLWVLMGAFAYTDEMKSRKPLRKADLLKYGFKNELLGRIAVETFTEAPSVEQMVRRVLTCKSIEDFLLTQRERGIEVDFSSEALAVLSQAVFDPKFGMRLIPDVVAKLKRHVVFSGPKSGVYCITKEMIDQAIAG